MELPINDIKLLEDNPRKMSPFMEQKTIESLLVFHKMLAVRPVVVNRSNVAIGGNQRVAMLRKIAAMSRDETRAHLMNQRKFRVMPGQQQEELLDYWDGWRVAPSVPVRVAEEFTEEEQREFVIKDNVHYGEDDMEKLAENFDIDLVVDYTGLDSYYSAREDYSRAEETAETAAEPQGEVLSVGCIATRLTSDEYNALESDISLYVQRMGAPDGYVTYLLK